MDANDPRPAPPNPTDSDARMRQWLALRDQLRELEAQLETFKLMLRLRGVGR